MSNLRVEGATSTSTEGHGLKKGVLSLTDVMVSGLANMGPAMSLFFSIAFLVGTIGTAVPFEIVLALFAILTLGNTMAQFSKKIPSSGSFITFVGHTFGAPFATASALTLVVGYIIAISGVVAVLGGWVATIFGRYNISLNWIVLMVIGMVVIAFLTIRGVRISAKWALAFFIFEAFVLILLGLVILAKGGAHGFSWAPFNPAHAAGGFKGITLGLPLVIFLFVGWENSAALAEETANPRRNVPRAILFGIVIIAFIYVFSAFTAMLGYGLTAKDITAFANDAGPFDTLGVKYLGSLRILVDIAGFTSIFATIVAAANSQTRILYNAGREGLLPRVFGRVTEKGQTPVVALLTYLGVAVALVIGFGYKVGADTFFAEASTLGTIPLILMYAAANIALPVYYWRKHRNEFRLVQHAIIPIVGVAVLALPFWGLVQPGQEAPYSFFPWIVLALVVISVIYTMVLVSRDKTLSQRALSVFKE